MGPAANGLDDDADDGSATEVVGETSPKGFAELWLVVVAAVDARMRSSSSLSKLSAVCARVAVAGAASRARDATSPAAAFASKSYRSISLVNSSFRCIALASKPSSSAFEMSSIRRGCIARHCSESSFATLDGDGGRRATQPSRTCVNTLSEFVATAMSPFNLSRARIKSSMAAFPTSPGLLAILAMYRLTPLI